MKCLAILASVFLSGCASPVLDIPDPPVQYQQAAGRTLYSDLSASRDLKTYQMLPAVNRVLGRVRNAALSTCRGLRSLPEERCWAVGQARVSVYTDAPDINAFADGNNQVGLYGGLIREMGSDEEIAAVLAHEFAHILFGHPQRKMQNAGVGLFWGAVLAATLGAGGASGDTYSKDIMEAGMNVGANAYSPQMEIEADRAAIYILGRAGYSPTAMRDAIVRMSQLRLKREMGGFDGTVGFLETHPSDERRISHILWAVGHFDAGYPLGALQRDPAL